MRNPGAAEGGPGKGVGLSTLFSVDELLGFNTADRDKSARDFLNVRVHPFAIFQPYPARIDADVSSGTPVRVRIAGLLEVNDVSKPVSFDLTTRLSKGQAAVAGSTTVAVGDYGVEVPQEAGGFVVVDPNITPGNLTRPAEAVIAMRRHPRPPRI